MQWDEPFKNDTINGAAGAVSELKLWLCAKIPTTTADYANDNCLKSPADADLASNPVAYLPAGDTLIPAGNYFLAIQLVTGTRPDLRFKVYWGQSDVLPGQSVTSGAATTAQHANTPSAFSVGAANFQQTPGYGQNPALLEPYSSWENQPVMYDANGERLPAPTVLLKPDLIGVDRTATSFFYYQDAEGVFRFPGTFAAAPNVAAVAALLIQQNPGITPDEVYAKLRAGAQDMFVGNTQGSDQPTAGPDRFTGYGFLNAGKALTQCAEGACCKNGMYKRDGAACAWSGGDDARFIADKSSLTYTASDSSRCKHHGQLGPFEVL